jgi:hypothetical protein
MTAWGYFWIFLQGEKFGEPFPRAETDVQCKVLRKPLNLSELTNANPAEIKKVNKVPVPAKGVVCHVVGPFKDVAIRTGERYIVELE